MSSRNTAVSILERILTLTNRGLWLGRCAAIKTLCRLLATVAVTVIRDAASQSEFSTLRLDCLFCLADLVVDDVLLLLGRLPRLVVLDWDMC